MLKSPSLTFREERVGDYPEVYSVIHRAFGKEDESVLVDKLRKVTLNYISCVAIVDDRIVGHIFFSPVTLDKQDASLMGLAPLAVDPDFQNQGIGSNLVEYGMEKCKEQEIGAVVVLGHKEYYPKFGFTPSVNFEITSEFDVAPEVFMIKELKIGHLNQKSGVIHYHSLFQT